MFFFFAHLLLPLSVPFLYSRFWLFSKSSELILLLEKSEEVKGIVIYQRSRCLALPAVGFYKVGIISVLPQLLISGFQDLSDCT